jgi:hypothetical protein
LLTFRPDFSLPWTGRSHLTQVTLHRLTRPQAAEMIRQVAHGKTLPPEVAAQVVAKTDGVPLFVEELTKMVLESGLLQEREDRYELTGPLPPLAHPYSLALAQHHAALLHHRRREASAVQAQADALLTLTTAQGFPLYVGYGTCWQGWALAVQGQSEAGLAQMHQGMAAVLAIGQTLSWLLCLVLLAEAAGHTGQVEEGLRLLAQALAALLTFPCPGGKHTIPVLVGLRRNLAPMPRHPVRH